MEHEGVVNLSQSISEVPIMAPKNVLLAIVQIIQRFIYQCVVCLLQSYVPQISIQTMQHCKRTVTQRPADYSGSLNYTSRTRPG